MYFDPKAGLSALNNPIALHANKPLAELHSPVLLLGGVHGDEPEGVWLATSTLALLQRERAKVDWALVPCLNVDGFAKGTRVNGRGVDLNRNYPSRSWSP